MRLDKYLIQENLATEEQIQEALDYQRLYGGRLESHLFRLGYSSEPDLVGALSVQLDYPGVTLSGRDIPEQVLKLVPAELVWDYLILPFESDREQKIIRIACEDPQSEKLQKVVTDQFSDKTMELYVALGEVLRPAIVKFYRNRPAPMDVETQPTPAPARTDAVTKAPSTPSETVKDAAASGSVPSGKVCRLVLLDRSEHGSQTLTTILKYQAFSITVSRSVDEFARAVREHPPDIQLLIIPGQKSDVVDLLSQLAYSDISVSETPTFLVVGGLTNQDIGELLRVGFEDVIRSESILDLLMIKLARVRDRLIAQKAHQRQLMQDLGTHGSLEDMNLIDLLQAMGMTGKTVRISVTGDGQQLAVFLGQGQIVHAECDGILGPEAVYQAISWTKGVWSVDSVSPETLPPPNCHLTNEAILLEGCRRLDESSRTDPLASLTEPGGFLDQLS